MKKIYNGKNWGSSRESVLGVVIIKRVVVPKVTKGFMHVCVNSWRIVVSVGDIFKF